LIFHNIHYAQNDIMSLTLDPAEILAARNSIDPVFLDSPAMQHPALDAALGCRCTLKVETLNPVRSFKGRGTEAFMAALKPLPRAVVAASAGNFGQGLARAAARRGVATTIFCAAGANPTKIAAMRDLGAEVHPVGQDAEDAKVAARAAAAEHGFLFVEDGTQREIAAGAGTIAQEMTDHGVLPDVLLVPVGDGALATGVGSWMRVKAPRTRIVGIAARGAPCMAQSFEAGRAISTAAAMTVADGIAIRVPIATSVAHLTAVVDEMLLVDDEAILKAVRLLLEKAGVCAEPAAAVGIAAVLAKPHRFRGSDVATIITGSHLDLRLLDQGRGDPVRP
jgi:threonine dehydratase